MAALRRLPILLALVAVTLFAAAPALAGKAALTGTITLDQPAPAYGDTVTFTTTYDSRLSHGNNGVHIRVVCEQDGVIVYDWTRGTSQTFTLAAEALPGVIVGTWSRGAADCEARLEYYKSSDGSTTLLASTTFHVT